MANIIYTHGNILDSSMQTITIPVNTVGAMGKGLALQFKNRYFTGFNVYRQACREGLLRVGRPVVYRYSKDKWFLFFPTKDHWKYPSRLYYIKEGLRWLQNNYASESIVSLAIPPLGCGLGGLQWNDVLPLVIDTLRMMDVTAEIYTP